MNAFFETLFYANSTNITWWAMSLRGVLVFFFAIAIIKIGGKRIFGKYNNIDIVLSIIMGAILANAIGGGFKFLPALLTCTVVTLLYRLLTFITYYSRFFGKLMKGSKDLLIEDGKINKAALRRNLISMNDLMEELRLEGKTDDVENIKTATLERNGSISIIFFEKKGE